MKEKINQLEYDLANLKKEVNWKHEQHEAIERLAVRVEFLYEKINYSFVELLKIKIKKWLTT